ASSAKNSNTPLLRPPMLRKSASASPPSASARKKMRRPPIRKRAMSQKRTTSRPQTFPSHLGLPSRRLSVRSGHCVELAQHERSRIRSPIASGEGEDLSILAGRLSDERRGGARDLRWQS